MIKKILISLTAIFILSGCSFKPAKIAYNKPETNQKIHVYSLIQQDELNAIYPVQDSSGVGSQFGLVGVLVTTSLDAYENAQRANITEQNLAGIRDELINFNFDQIFNEEISTKLKNNVHIESIKTVKSQKQIEEDLKLGDTYLVLNTSYKMDIDFRTPFITTEVTIAKKVTEDSLEDDTKLYKNNFTYFGHSLPAPQITDLSPEEIEEIKKANTYFDEEDSSEPITLDEVQSRKFAAQAWTDEYKGRLEKNLRSGIQNLLTLISNDIKDTTPPESYEDKGSTLEGYPPVHKSMLVEENEDNKVIRYTVGRRAGAICSMPVKYNEGKILCL